MKTPIFAILFIATLAINTPAIAQFKCEDSGKFIYQDLPCIDRGSAIKLHPGSGHANTSTAESAAKSQKMITDSNWRGKILEAIASGRPMVGMSRAELDQAMGQPTKVNSANYSGILKDQIIYRQPSQTWYIYTTQGIVDSIQHTPEQNTTNTSSKRACPSPYTIRDMETSASSISLGDAERAERLKQINEAKKCYQS